MFTELIPITKYDFRFGLEGQLAFDGEMLEEAEHLILDQM